MRKLFPVLILFVLFVSALPAASSGFGNDAFVRSIESFRTEIEVFEKSSDGDPEKDVVAMIVDENEKKLDDVIRPRLDVVDSKDMPTAENAEALKKIEIAINEVEEAGTIDKVLPKRIVTKLKEKNINPKKLAVGVVFDVRCNEELDEEHQLVFKVKNKAIEKIQDKDIYTGKYIIFQQNEETGEYEVLNPSGEHYFDSGHYEINGDEITITVSHLCVFMVAAETHEEVRPFYCCWWCRLWHCNCYGGVNGNDDCHGFCWCCHWWILIILLIVLIVALVLMLNKNEDDDENSEEETADKAGSLWIVILLKRLLDFIFTGKLPDSKESVKLIQKKKKKDDKVRRNGWIVILLKQLFDFIFTGNLQASDGSPEGLKNKETQNDK